MKILSLDSTALTASVALCDDEKLLSLFSVNVGLTHSETLLPLLENVLKYTSTDIDEISLFAMSEGPGSFTGVRIGAATIKGIAFGKDKPCIGVSTLEALAHNLITCKGMICPVMNARRDQVYNAVFESDGRGTLTRLCDDRAISVPELLCELSEKKSVVYLCGDGYDMVASRADGIALGFVPDLDRWQNAYSVAMCALLAYRSGKYTSDRDLKPTYLRLPQAERERLENLSKNN